MVLKNNIRVVLVETSHPGNIGATARAMANMGMNNLVLVRPADFPSDVARARAAGAIHVLNDAKIVDTLEEAVADCNMVIGLTARLREISWPQLTPEEAANESVNGSSNEIAIVFGRERSGLTNNELDLCQYLVRIPVSKDFSSLNVASAVLVMLYEISKVSELDQSSTAPIEGEQKATSGDIQNFYGHLEKTLKKLEFGDGRSTKLHRKLKRLFYRTDLPVQEINMLRGILTAIDEKLE